MDFVTLYGKMLRRKHSKVSDHYLSQVKNRFSLKVEQFPALIILLGLLNGIIPVILNKGVSHFSVLLFPCLFVVILALLFKRKDFLKIVIFTLVGFALSLWSLSKSENSNVPLIPNKNCGAIIEAVVTDSS